LIIAVIRGFFLVRLFFVGLFFIRFLVVFLIAAAAVRIVLCVFRIIRSLFLSRFFRTGFLCCLLTGCFLCCRLSSRFFFRCPTGCFFLCASALFCQTIQLCLLLRDQITDLFRLLTGCGNLIFVIVAGCFLGIDLILQVRLLHFQVCFLGLQ